MNFECRDIIAINDLSKEDILHVLSVANSFKQSPQPELLRGCLMGSCFFEPSTRTRLSFEAAMARLGGQIIGFSESSSTSVKKGESLSDSMKMMEQYVDVVVIRHPLEGSAQVAADTINIPVLNGGDGANQHPTQTLLDLFTIQECQGRIDDLHLAMVGDLKRGRTVHSLAEACAHFNIRLYFISPEGLEMPKDICDHLRGMGVKFTFHKEIEEVIDRLDILYMTRIQAERFISHGGYEKMRNPFCVTMETLLQAKSSLRVMHPLPRLNEIDTDVDTSDFAYYFQQAGNGLYVRQALLALVLGKVSSPELAPR